jgi:sugar phosphate isomerase/epimerase
MKFGCIATIADYKALEKAGLDYVELSGRNVAAMEVNEFKQLRRLVRSGVLPCLGFNAYCPPNVRIAGPGFSLAAAKEYAKRSLARAAELNVQVVGVGSPMSRNLPEGYHRYLAMRQAEEFFAVTAEVFAAQNICICVEALGPCYCNFINRLAEAQGIVRAVNMENVKLVLDFYNMEHSGEADIPLFPFINDIVHAHISDDAGSPQKRWFLKPEKRELHAARVRRLRDAGYQGAMTLEIDLPADVFEVKQSLDILKGVVQTY